MRSKICGITNIDDGLLCAKLGADAVGFVFYQGSPRFVPIPIAKSISSALPFFLMKVGIFVNEKPEIVNNISRQVGLNAVQLHGDETPMYIESIDVPVIKSFRISASFDFQLLRSYNNCGLLLDSFSKTSHGGTGKTFNWNLIPDEFKNKIILAGGINSENVKSICHHIRPMAIDLSSSLEISPGMKDKKKLIDFFTALKLLRN